MAGLPTIADLIRDPIELARSALEPAEESSQKLYPNCDTSIWLRSCTHEVEQPLPGVVTGTIPRWLKGTLLRNGPGKLQVGETRCQHLFDSAALLHRFAVKDGEVTYQCRFVKTNSYNANMAAQRIVVTEFGTTGVPDPCQSIFQRVAAIFNPGESMSDNTMISVYPFGDEFYTFTETPVMHRIDPATLDTLERVNLTKHVGIANHTAHPLVMSDGTVYNIGTTYSTKGLHYCVMKFPPPKVTDNRKYMSPFSQASIVGTIPVRWRLHPSYMHSFGVTEHYFVIVEQPLSVSVPTMLKCQINNEPFIAALQWYKDEQTRIHLMNRKDGTLAQSFIADAFFYLHIINSYELDGHVVLDMCCYRDANVLNCMYVDAMEACQGNTNYASMFRSRPLRFVLPVKTPDELNNDIKNKAKENKTMQNLVTLQGTKASAFYIQRHDIFVKPELLCDIGCETPQVNLGKYLGKPYRYFYAISSDVDLENPGTLIKVDTKTHQKKTWCETNVFPSEPIFVPSPNAMAEDDGVILSAIIWGSGMENKVGLLVLDASNMEELGRATFTTPGPVPKCLHGWFAANVT